jgi:hypothetical protein
MDLVLALGYTHRDAMSGLTAVAPELRIQRSDGRIRAAVFFCVAAVLSIGYYLIISGLERQGYVGLSLAFFGEKGALALHGLPPRLVNVGFVYPPLSYLLQLGFPTVLVGQAVISGVIVTGILDFLQRQVADRVLRLLAQAYVLASPVFLLLTITDHSTLLFALMLAASVHYITRFLRDDYSLYLFVGSTLLGLTFFVDFRSAALLIAIVPAAAIPLWRRSRAQAISVALTIAVPTIFFALAWSYVNWIFLGDPFAYAHGRGSLFRTFPETPALLAAAGDPLQTLKLAGLALLTSLPVTLPYFVGLASMRGGRAAYTIPAVVVYASPIVFIVASIYGGLYQPTIALLALFVLVFLFSLDAIKPSIGLTAAVAISLAASFYAPFVAPLSGERAFGNALIGRGETDANLTPFRTLAAHVGTDGPILIDDSALYPLVYVLGSAARFILPYQYEYASVLSNPGLFVKYVVVARRADDTIYALYPGAEFGRMPGFHEYYRSLQFIVFQRDGVT